MCVCVCVTVSPWDGLLSILGASHLLGWLSKLTMTLNWMNG